MNDFSVWEFFLKGGILMWPILLLSIISWVLFVYKLINYIQKDNESRTFFGSIWSMLNIDHEELLNSEEGRSNPPIHLKEKALKDINRLSNELKEQIIPARILDAAFKLYNIGANKEEIKNIIEEQGSQEVTKLENLLSYINTIASVAPLLGLLGTILGMINSLSNLAAKGIESNSAQVLDGIWTALITTAAGLIVAIPAIFFYNFLTDKLNRMSTFIETQSSVFLHYLTYKEGL